MSRDRILADLEALFRETGNPLYTWKAFAEECPPGEPLPGWVEDYLRACACRVLDVAEQKPPDLFGLTRDAFEDYRRAQDDANVAMLYEHLLGQEPGASEALVQRAALERGESRASIHRRIKRARTRWDAQKR